MLRVSTLVYLQRLCHSVKRELVDLCAFVVIFSFGTHSSGFIDIFTLSVDVNNEATEATEATWPVSSQRDVLSTSYGIIIKADRQLYTITHITAGFLYFLPFLTTVCC